MPKVLGKCQIHPPSTPRQICGEQAYSVLNLSTSLGTILVCPKHKAEHNRRAAEQRKINRHP